MWWLSSVLQTKCLAPGIHKKLEKVACLLIAERLSIIIYQVGEHRLLLGYKFAFIPFPVHRNSFLLLQAVNSKSL